MRLDKSTVSALALSRGRRELFAWDTELPGFGLRLQGAKRTFVAQYRANGQSRRQTLGPASQAREAARKVLAKMSLGHDPQAEKAAKRIQAERTFAKAVDAYLAAKQPALRPTSFRLAALYLRGPYFRPVHGVGLADITHADVAARLSAVARDHSSHTAAAARRQVGALFRWAMEEGWISANPVIATRKPVEAAPRERVLSDSEIAAIWRACNGDDHGGIVKLLILLGCRRQEIGARQPPRHRLAVAARPRKSSWTLCVGTHNAADVRHQMVRH
jgi:integrase